MKVFLDSRWPVGTGIGRMLDLYCLNVPTDISLVKLNIATNIGSPLSPLAVSAALYKQRKTAGQHIFWNPGFIPPLPRIMKSVITVHDLTHLHFYTAKHRYYYNAVFKPLYRRCEHIVCISQHTCNEFLEWSGMGKERVSVVPNAIDPAFASLSDPLPHRRPFVFYAGNRRHYKNVPMLIQAFGASGLAREGVELVLTGPFDTQLQAMATKSGAGQALRFAGFLSDSQLVAYYKSASCFAFLSKYEGFGLPILEAMECDTPLLLASASSLPEVAADAALYVDPDDIESIANGLRQLCSDEALRRSLIHKGRLRRQIYRADVSSAKLWDLIKRVSQQ